MEDLFARSAYQVFLYVLLFIGTAAMGGFVGFILSFLYHERQKDRQKTPEEVNASGEHGDES